MAATGCLLAALSSAAAATQQAPPATDERDLLVTAARLPGSVIADVPPVAILMPDQLRALGAMGTKQLLERIRQMAGGAGGEPPVTLLNGRRVANDADLYGIPVEAMERTEILPEQEAVRFGFAPTRQVVNYITKKRFHATTVQQLAGITPEGGGATNYAEAVLTRIDGPRRSTLSVSHFRQGRVLQSQRDIAPDPATLYAIGGNVTGVGGGSIDPRLDLLAGRAVTVAGVPADPAARRVLGGYVATAGRPAITDIGNARTLVPRTDMIRVDGSMAMPIGGTVDASFSLSMEAQRNRGLNGLAPVMLTVPGGGGALPFERDVLLYRYLPDAVLRQSGSGLTLRAGGTVQGAIGEWSWNVTGNYDRLRATATAEQGVATDALQGAVDAGADPLSAVDPARPAQRLVARSRTVTGTLTGRATASGPVGRLPAGVPQVTLSADYARSASVGEQAGAPVAAADVTRTVRGAAVTASVPIASADEEVLGFLGRLSANGSLGVSQVSDFGRLSNSIVGLNWAPSQPIQFAASIADNRTPPDITLLTAPILVSPNVPFFDFVTGQSPLVSVTSGGNPALAPGRERTVTVGAALAPFGDRLQARVDVVETRRRGQNFALGVATPALQAAFPERFVRDATGRLVAVDLRPVNLAGERERRLRLTLNGSAAVGRRPVASAPVAPRDGPPPPPPPRPIMLFGSVTTDLRLDDRVTLRPGLPALNLLDGATLDGTGGRPRWAVDGTLGVGKGPMNVSLYARLQGPTRVRSATPEADLRFSGRTWFVLFATLDTETLVARPWAKRLSLSFTVENLLNDRIDVRDATGATPNRFQPGYLDPIGRSIRLGLRKQF